MLCGICGRTALYRYSVKDTEGRCREHKDMVPEQHRRYMRKKDAAAAWFGETRKRSDHRLLNPTRRRSRGTVAAPHHYR